MSKRLKNTRSRAGAEVDAKQQVRSTPPPPDVIQLAPVPIPAVGSRLVGRRFPGEAGRSRLPPLPAYRPTAEAAAWQDRMRRAESNKGRPLDIKKRLLCRRGHVLLWLVTSPWGVTPIARTATGRFTLRVSGLHDGAPMSLREWPAGEHLPIASCSCHEEVEVSVHEGRSWLESAQDKVVYRPVRFAATEYL